MPPSLIVLTFWGLVGIADGEATASRIADGEATASRIADGEATASRIADGVGDIADGEA